MPAAIHIMSSQFTLDKPKSTLKPILKQMATHLKQADFSDCDSDFSRHATLKKNVALLSEYVLGKISQGKTRDDLALKFDKAQRKVRLSLTGYSQNSSLIAAFTQ